MHQALVLVVVLGGCVAVADDEVVDLDLTTQQAASCPKWLCGSNDPRVTSSIAGLSQFHELNKTGIANKEGMTVLGLDVPAAPGRAAGTYNVDVTGAKLYGKKSGLSTLSGAGLVGTSILVKWAGRTNKLKIIAVGTTKLWPDTGATAETYRIDQRDQDETDDSVPWTNLCSMAESLPPDDGGMGGPLLGMNKWSVVLYEGERVDSVSKVISAGSTDWFNIGCAGHVLAKTFLTRHTWASQGGGYTNTRDQRQAMLRMYVADYCGDGTPFTQSGEPLGWVDDKNWFSYLFLTPKLEARWGPNGATCLEVPRMAETDTAGKAFFPDIEAAIAKRCKRPPTCTAKDGSVDPTKFFGTHIVSANPP